MLDSSKLNELVTSEENTFPHFVESLLGIDAGDIVEESAASNADANNVDLLSELASINQCLTKDSLRQLDRKLVRFDC